jgi:hypothetical protein
LVRIYSKDFLENVAIEELAPDLGLHIKILQSVFEEIVGFLRRMRQTALVFY